MHVIGSFIIGNHKIWHPLPGCVIYNQNIVFQALEPYITELEHVKMEEITNIFCPGHWVPTNLFFCFG